MTGAAGGHTREAVQSPTNGHLALPLMAGSLDLPQRDHHLPEPLAARDAISSSSSGNGVGIQGMASVDAVTFLP